jgi:hypothetical protein
MELQKMKKSILAAGALSLAVSFAFGTMASAQKLEEPKDDPEVAEPIGGLSAPAVAGGGLLLALALGGNTTPSTPPTTP